MRLVLTLNAVLTMLLVIALVILSLSFSERIDATDRKVQIMGSGLTAAEQYLEPEYHNYLRDEISNLWQAIRD